MAIRRRSCVVARPGRGLSATAIPVTSIQQAFARPSTTRPKCWPASRRSASGSRRHRPLDPQIAAQERLKWRVHRFLGLRAADPGDLHGLDHPALDRPARPDRARRSARGARTTLSFAMAARGRDRAGDDPEADRAGLRPAGRAARCPARSARPGLAQHPVLERQCRTAAPAAGGGHRSLLRFHALYEDTVRKLAVASAVPAGTLTNALNALVEIGTAAVTAIEASLGIERAPEPAPKPKAAPPTAAGKAIVRVEQPAAHGYQLTLRADRPRHLRRASSPRASGDAAMGHQQALEQTVGLFYDAAYDQSPAGLVRGRPSS